MLVLLTLAAQAQLRVSDNQRYLLREGKPFFYLGDTAWELLNALGRDDTEKYLRKRADQGFTVIQAVALAELDGLHTGNYYGNKPLLNDDPTTPNDAYFQHVDFVIDKAAEFGLVIGLLPTWGDKLWKAGWGTGPEVFTAENARVYGKWLGNRYKDKKNLIWILGGDRNPRNADDVNLWREMAAGIQEGVGGADKALISYHPQPNEQGSGEWFHADAWLDFNMFQNGHCRDQAIYDRIFTAYNRTPLKPVMDAEPIYEDHPVCFNAHDLGTSNAYDVRKFAYLDLFAGAHGHTYGCHDIWQMYRPGKSPVNGPHMFWNEALELPGARQMVHVRNLMEARPFLDRIPDQSFLVENNLVPAERIQATRGKDYLFVYTAAGKSFTLKLGVISGKTLTGFWYDPRNGESKPIEAFANQGTKTFAPPRAGYGQDWVLILDDASKKYPAPGK